MAAAHQPRTPRLDSAPTKGRAFMNAVGSRVNVPSEMPFLWLTTTAASKTAAVGQ